MENQVINEKIPANAKVADRQNAFYRIAVGLRQHEDVGCEHIEIQNGLRVTDQACNANSATASYRSMCSCHMTLLLSHDI